MIIANYGSILDAIQQAATYDWEANRWSSLPLGIKVSQLHKFGKLPVQFALNYEHNFADDSPTSPKNTYRFIAKFLFPTIL